MADTVKKSRIVSDDEDNLEEALLEEFNLRLKNCMSKDDIQAVETESEEPDTIYENVSNSEQRIPKSAIASNDFLQNERHHYDLPPDLENPSEDRQLHVENIYETLPERPTEKTDPADQQHQHEPVETNLTLSLSPKVETTCYEDLEVDKPSFSLETTDFSELRSPEEPGKSVKDRMFLGTDDAATLLFTQTVTSPMLTPSEENIDFLKGFQSSDTTGSNDSPPAELDKTSSSDGTAVGEALVRENEAIYENLKGAPVEENIYENLRDVQKAVEDLEEHIYQDIDECAKEDEVYENVEDVEQPPSAELMVDNSLYVNVEGEESKEELEADLDVSEAKVVEEETHYESIGVTHEETTEYHKEESHSEAERHTETETVESNDESLEVRTRETYSEFIHHSKTESNYCEKYTEVLTRNITSPDVGNKEKDTETVPAEIVKNLKSQFSKSGGAEVVSITKKEVGDGNELKDINIMQQINKFETSDSGDSNDSTVTESYSETTTIQSDVPEEKSLKKKKIKKSRKEEKENISVKSSFSKFDALQKKNVLHIRSSDSTKAQDKFNGSQTVDSSNCRACAKQVFQMEQMKAEKAVWHKNCFRCTECSKQLSVETYVSHDGNLYCKPHFKSLFAPKVVEEESPPSDKPDLGLENLQSLNVKERFQVFEQFQTEAHESDREPAPINVKKSSSILSKLARFQAKGMDVGVSDDALNGVPIEESSSEEEAEEEVPEGEDPTLYRARRVQKEKPFHFTNLSEVKNKWEQGEQNARDERREEKKQEIQSIRNKLFLGKQGRMKEAYQQAIIQSESCTNLVKSEKIESCDTKSLKERFEKGQLSTEKEVKSGDEDTEVFQSEISKKSRSLFLELDANASKAPQISPVKPQKLEVQKARETDTPEREIYHDPEVVRSDEIVDDSVIAKTSHTASKMLNKFRQMEENLSREPEQVGPKPLKRFTPPPEPARPESDSEEGSETEEESEEGEDQMDNQKLPEDLVEAQKAARAKQLRAKFEKWEAQEIKREQTQTVNIVEEYGDESQVESTKSLRARFESMKETGSDTSRTQRVKVNRFV